MDKISSEQRFRDLFNKKRGSLILGVIVFCLITFGADQTLTWFVWILASTPFVVVFWATIGHRIIDLNKLIRLRSTLKRSAIKNTSHNMDKKKEAETRDYLKKV